jgi:hypothetical protein
MIHITFKKSVLSSLFFSLRSLEDFILLDRALIRCKRCHALTYIEVLSLGDPIAQ